MTEIQFAILIGTIWLAPHSEKTYSIVAGLSFILVAVVKGLGWL